MVPLGVKARDWIWKSDDAPNRSLALSHAAFHDRPGLWGNDPEHPTSVVWVREGDGGVLEAFAAGVPRPVLNWLSARSRGRTIALLAPPSWEEPVRSRGGRVEAGTVETWIDVAIPRESTSRAEVRRLGPDDGLAFEALAPSWALRSWGDFATMIGRGIAFGVPMAGGFAALAWSYESDQTHEKIGVVTVPRFRRLGLGRAAAGRLVDLMVFGRRKLPVWVANPENEASIALARSLGFSTRVSETLIRWTPDRA